MATQSEQALENNLIAQLVGLGYKQVSIGDEDALIANLKTQLEKHNKITLSKAEFKQVLNALNKGNIYEKAKILRERVSYKDDEGESRTLELVNQIQWCQNSFQVTHQVSMEGSYKNRYDVTLLINGLPLVQVELKRRGLELKEAFNQINRYERHSFGAGQGLFNFIQLFVISNGVNTKYYANSPVKARSFKQTFYWSDEKNKQVRGLSEFTEVFLERCHLAKMITKYIVLHESDKILMVLRPYQFYAVEAIVERVKNCKQNGYIWHTTGSGKTLTSFKAAQILTNLNKVDKVVFVVDRRDLDYQTTKEFNAFSTGSIDGTDNTRTLVRQMADRTKLLVTTIQKLNTAISKKRYLSQMEATKEKNIVFIFDECHRSQFGKTHEDIKNYFAKAQMFGFTGTPIFEQNAGSNEYGKRTTAMLFDKCLHKYVITDAIRDENVLKFSIEYISTFKKKEHIDEIEVEAIDETEVMNAPKRLDIISDYIIANHARKTHSREFTAMFAVSSVETLIAYYKLFAQKKAEGKHKLRIATIFSYQANEEDKDTLDNSTADMSSEWDEMGMVAEPDAMYGSKHSREYLDEFIADYNAMYGSNYSTKDSKSFYNYYNNIAQRVKRREIDILLVVNMFLTGFDSKRLNTLYVDKNLQYHGLIQAYSRTNRILNELKSQGNIVCFRNLKKATDDAIELFSTLDAKEEILLKPYEEYVGLFDKAYETLLDIAPTVQSVDELVTEEDELAFVKAFREIMRLKTVLSTFTEFGFDDLGMSEQGFEDYKSKYLDLYDKTKNHTQKEKISILDDIDFELELIHKDEINVGYILQLLGRLKSTHKDEQAKEKKAIMELLSGDAKMRSKRELIDKFIEEHLPTIEEGDEIAEKFEAFWEHERVQALQALSKDEKLEPEKLQHIIEEYLFTQKEPLRDDIIAMMQERPKLKERKTIAQRVNDKIVAFVEMFVSGMGW